jgi:hypothetical protein
MGGGPSQDEHINNRRRLMKGLSSVRQVFKSLASANHILESPNSIKYLPSNFSEKFHRRTTSGYFDRLISLQKKPPLLNRSTAESDRISPFLNLMNARATV